MPKPFAVTEASPTPDRAVFAVVGELDLATCDILTSALDAALRREPAPTILVDLSDLEFCDSSGLTALLRAVRQAEMRHVEIALTRPPDPSWRAFELSAMDQVLPWVDEGDAVAAVARMAG
jgi:anti-sigma B factor antagonist